MREIQVGQSLFLEKSNFLIFAKRAKKYKKSDLLFCLLFHSFRKERKSELLFVALFVKSKRANCSLLLFWQRTKVQTASMCSFGKDEKVIALVLSFYKEGKVKLL